MDLKFLGIGSAFTPHLGNNSCYYIQNDTMLLIDCGWDVYPKIRNLNLLKDINKLYILCTHTHQDHIGSMATLISWCSLVVGIKVFVVLPNDIEFRNAVISTLTNGDVYCDENYYVVSNMKNVFTNLSEISFFRVEHCEKIKSYGIKFYFKNNSFMIYSGDCANIQSVLTEISLETNLVFLKAYIDCNLKSLSQINSIKPHELLSDLTDSIPLNERHLFYTMHYDSYECRNQAKLAGFNIVQTEI